tara:strand:- start:343 stop:1209 length:867 start_codon:yes stop_codon:yes gene_type:complete
MRLEKVHWIGIIFSIVILLADIVFFRGEKIFVFLIGIGLVVAVLPFIFSLVLENSREKEKNEMFLEFTRNLAESVKSGNPIAQSILNMKNKDFGALTPHVKKLANQISLGIPMSKSFHNFGKDVGSLAVQRAITLIREAEEAGGKISNILDSVAESIYEIEKLKKERQSAIYALVVQGYIIFLIFIGIMLVMQFHILPLATGIGGIGGMGGGIDGMAANSGEGGGSGDELDIEQLSSHLLILLVVQGLFTGLVVGKLAGGSLKSGIKHSFILAVMAFLIGTGANAFAG